ncbi:MULTISPECIES: DUF6538 domain-containing protein [Methylobacteriaceae]|uniref:DUF6538 domain-containing protein n=1 Tax=Methylobacteriaceae TaxID=119045 RepID=UPI002F35FA72
MGSHVYRLRRRVPADLVALVGRREVTVSLSGPKSRRSSHQWRSDPVRMYYPSTGGLASRVSGNASSAKVLGQDMPAHSQTEFRCVWRAGSRPSLCGRCIPRHPSGEHLFLMTIQSATSVGLSARYPPPAVLSLIKPIELGS